MAIAPGFEYDLFISYAHVDNEEGWVAQLVKRLEPAIRQRLGFPEALKIFIDDHATGANSHLPELLTKVKRSALLLAIGSPSYVAHDWTLQELAAFMEGVPDLARLFMIEYLPLNEGARYPSPLDSNIRLEFWKPGVRRHIPVPLEPISDAEWFSELVRSLAANIYDQLVSLRLLSGATRPEATFATSVGGVSRSAGNPP